MTDYKPNSHRYKEEQKTVKKEREKVEKVISGTAKLRKKSKAHKLTDVFISEDASNVKSYIFADVLVPALKKLISDIVKDGIEMVLYGGTGRGSSNSKRIGASYVSYNRFADHGRDRAITEPRSRIGYSYDNIEYTTRGEAEEVLDRMCELIEMYGSVAVADLYDLSGISHQYTDNKYGWTNLSTAKPVRVRDGYILDLPRAIPID